MSRHGHRLRARDDRGNYICPESGWRYQEMEPDRLCCLDWDAQTPLASQ